MSRKPTIEVGPSGHLILTVPSPTTKAESQVKFPPTADGMAALALYLTKYQSKPNDRRIGEEGAVTQAIVDAWLAKKEVEDQRKFEELNAKLNLNLDIDLSSLGI